MSFIFKSVDTVDTISREDFKKNYLDPRKPLIIKNLSKDWPAREKWTLDYFKEIAGDLQVDLVDNSKADPSKAINAKLASMKFGDYLDLIKREPTELRIFFLNLFKHSPELLNDIKIPKELMGGFIESMPAMFFGGTKAITFLHYDIDLPHLFHTHFGGRKHIILFDNKWKKRLYCIPNTTYALEDYDVANPDFEKIEKFCDEYIDVVMENPYLPLFVINEVNQNPFFFMKKMWGAKSKPDPSKFLAQIEEEVKKNWNFPASWKLIAQMPFGKPTAQPGEKEFQPLEKRLFIKNLFSK